MIVVIQGGDYVIVATTCDDGVLSSGSVGWFMGIEVDMRFLEDHVRVFICLMNDIVELRKYYGAERSY